MKKTRLFNIGTFFLFISQCNIFSVLKYAYAHMHVIDISGMSFFSAELTARFD
jgi:hypothetical protein